jgi:tetratricopeptide (TPR) repeat protein
MSFDKIKAMRNAERYLSQGKIKAAISEYRQVSDNDPKDFGTLNMLGDLYAKNAQTQEAIGCFTRVAEYYGKQGFAQKAIAIYNKIAKLQPDSLEVSAKLAELYQAKGSFAEAKTHYVTLAEQFQKSGKKMEALSVWKQIAGLDPTNTEVYLKIAESYWQENQKDEAAEAFVEAGSRLASQDKHEAALTAFSRALEIRQNDFNALNGFVKAQISLGYSDEAAKSLEQILEKQPYNREILFLLVDCHLDTGNPQEAEKAVIRLVEQEPANYPKFLELIEAYIKINELEAAARILSMSSEHLLVGGQSDDFLKWTDEILARNPEQLDALRLLVRYHSWHRDESELKQALERLAEISRLVEAGEDERYAVSQLVIMLPHETGYAKRLEEINSQYGFPDELPESLLPAASAVDELVKNSPSDANGFAVSEVGETQFSVDRFGEYKQSISPTDDANPFETDGFEINGFSVSQTETVEASVVSEVVIDGEVKDEEPKNLGELSLAETHFIEKELEGIEFYIAQGYKDLAAKSLDVLEERFGQRAEFAALREQTDDSLHKLAEKTMPQVELVEEEQSPETLDQDLVNEAASVEEIAQNYDFLNDFRDELDLEESQSAGVGEDFETHFQMATAYKEMGLTEEAIREFQESINIVTANDGTRRFFQCAHYLGNCFMEKQMPNLALMWYQRALETADLNDDEQQGIWYEIATAHEAGGEIEKALENFERIYAVNLAYRDVAQRIQNLHINS